MKIFKRILIIALLIAIIYMVYYLYLKFNQDNISISNLMAPVFSGETNSVINLDSSGSYNSTSIAGIEDSTSNDNVSNTTSKNSVFWTYFIISTI